MTPGHRNQPNKEGKKERERKKERKKERKLFFLFLAVSRGRTESCTNIHRDWSADLEELFLFLILLGNFFFLNLK